MGFSIKVIIHNRFKLKEIIMENKYTNPSAPPPYNGDEQDMQSDFPHGGNALPYPPMPHSYAPPTNPSYSNYGAFKPTNLGPVYTPQSGYVPFSSPQISSAFVHPNKQQYPQGSYYNSPVASSAGTVPVYGNQSDAKNQTQSSQSMFSTISKPFQGWSDVEGGYNAPTHNRGEGDGLQSFGENAVRLGFMRKVYGILMFQLILTGAIIGFFMGVKQLRDYTKENVWICLTAAGMTIILMLIMVCFESARRKSPLNFIFLAIFTAFEGVMLGATCVYYDASAVLISVGICAAVTLALTIFAMQTTIDFTAWRGALFALLMILLVAGIMLMILPANRYVMIGYGAAGALIFSLYIIYDTQMMMGGEHKYSISPEEYIFASLTLYLDIINLFLYILRIVSAIQGGDN